MSTRAAQAGHSRQHRRSARLTLLMLAIAFLAAIAAGTIAYRTAIARLEAGLEQTLIVNRRAIESEIERFRYLPRVLGEDIRIQNLVSDPDSTIARDRANSYLETVAAQSGAAQLYVLNDRGTALAASNYLEPGSFVGNNYSFRPYFTGAVDTGEGRYYAIGVTTGRPGYFLSSRIAAAGADGKPVTGIVVAKVDLESLEQAWQAAGARTAIADRNGIVFLSGEPGWKYRPLAPLDATIRSRIDAERTYEGVDVFSAAPLMASEATMAPASGENSFLAAGSAGRSLLSRFKKIDPDGWLVIAATDPSTALSLAWFWALVAGLAGLLCTGAVRYAAQRRMLLDLRLGQTEMLERMVGERTRELARENEIRRRAEADLREAQEGLIHSEKMAALGRMSSAIVHEVSQPLAALETTLATAETLAGREKAQGVRDRVKAARALIRRMQRTVKHLKDFGRKDTGARTLVDIDDTVRNALDVVRPRAKAAAIEPAYTPKGVSPQVFVVAVKIEQVLINLLINALDAVEGRAGGAITIGSQVIDGRVRLSVTDNGAGIAPENLARVTEPFFTTKLSGEGLGLGLSISNAILREYGGGLGFETPPDGGTVAIVEIPLAEPEAGSHRTAAE